jgi:hypothetical protein
MKNKINYIQIFVAAVLLFGELQAQHAIGKKSVSGSGLLDFAADSQKVIVLPLLDSLTSSASKGTMAAYRKDSSIYMRNDSAWVKYSTSGLNPLNSLNHSGTEKIKSTVLGSKTTNVEGALVLESSNKALILPKNSNPHSQIPMPRIGSICYDKTRKSLAIFNGKIWTYWQ